MSCWTRSRTGPSRRPTSSPTARKQLLGQGDPKIRDRGRSCSAAIPTPTGAGRSPRRTGPWRCRATGTRGGPCSRRRAHACHKAEGRGEDVGPDLATVTGRTPEDLLIHILDPNREVPPQYLDYSVATADGRVVTGLIAAESAGSVTLKRGGGVIERRPSRSIEAIASSGVSLMPEGLEKGLTNGDLADLISYLRGLSATAAPGQPATGR